jgi:hypothetical protein
MASRKIRTLPQDARRLGIDIARIVPDMLAY